jgi:type II secretory ATPase GspE/PulE/Tfp pilus assembly ATPase PilB-like protein
MSVDTIAAPSIDVLDILGQIEIFRTLRREDLQEIAAIAQKRTYTRDDKVVSMGDIGEEMFIILRGAFQVFQLNQKLGVERNLVRLLPGQYFGEISLLSGGKRTASVRADETSEVLVLSKSNLMALLERCPVLASGLLQGLARYVETHSQKASSIPFASLDEYPNVRDAFTLLPVRISLYCEALVVDKQDRAVTVAMVNPFDERTRQFVMNVLREWQVSVVAIAEDEFERFRDRYLLTLTGVKPAADEEMPVSYTSPSANRPAILGGNPAGEYLAKIFREAVHFGASDVHVHWNEQADIAEPLIRLRLDGQLAPFHEHIGREQHAALMSRIKIMGDLDITERRMSQDGRFVLRVDDKHIEVRCSYMPCKGGEKIVLRLLDPKQRKLDLTNLVIEPTLAEIVKEVFLSPHGLILVTGPTGSGKTTTLNAGLEEIWKNTRAVNIVTIEDPVEYHLPYATQISVNRAIGMDFAQILRTVLRQDPNIILVGEIRDEESARVALDAATTGHLVLSSLHTHFALETIVRLRNLKIEPYLLGDALRAIISQKLVRRVCRACARPVDPNEKVIEKLRDMNVLEKEDQFTILRGQGCEVCRNEGELGRIAVFEMLIVKESLREMIERQVPVTVIGNVLSTRDFISMKRYARYLLQEGLVSPDAVARIFPPPLKTGEDEDL